MATPEVIVIDDDDDDEDEAAAPSARPPGVPGLSAPLAQGVPQSHPLPTHPSAGLGEPAAREPAAEHSHRRRNFMRDTGFEQSPSFLPPRVHQQQGAPAPSAPQPLAELWSALEGCLPPDYAHGLWKSPAFQAAVDRLARQQLPWGPRAAFPNGHPEPRCAPPPARPKAAHARERYAEEPVGDSLTYVTEEGAETIHQGCVLLDGAVKTAGRWFGNRFVCKKRDSNWVAEPHQDAMHWGWLDASVTDGSVLQCPLPHRAPWTGAPRPSEDDDGFLIEEKGPQGPKTRSKAQQRYPVPPCVPPGGFPELMSLEKLGQCDWSEKPSGHVLLLDLDNVSPFFTDGAQWEIDHGKYLIPEHCFVLAFWSSGYMNTFGSSHLRGSMLERLIGTGRLKADVAGRTSNASDIRIFGVVVSMLSGQEAFPLTLISGDRDFDELLGFARDAGHSFKRLLSYCHNATAHKKQVLDGFFVQLRSRLGSTKNRKVSAQSSVTPNDGCFDFLSNNGLHNQARILDHKSDRAYATSARVTGRKRLCREAF
ncbi:hypothetical protein DIPPA_26059 [Diplonema papillatum]|nr:hypothetical protein DIPPA_26059 [Diplonema papillatum]